MARFGGGGSFGAPPGTKPRAFVLGSRPAATRLPPVPNIKPGAAGTTQYGKKAPSAAGAPKGTFGMSDLE